MTTREAIEFLVDEICIDDFIYMIRDRAGENPDGFKGNLWGHPLVEKYALACATLKKELTTEPSNGDLTCAGCGCQIGLGKSFLGYCCGSEGP